MTPSDSVGPSDRSDDTGGVDVAPVVLYPVFESFDSAAFEIARDVAEGSGSTLLVLDLLDTPADVIDESRSVGASMLQSQLDDAHDAEIQTRYEETDDPVETVVEVAREHDTRLIVFDSHAPDSLLRPAGGHVEDRVSTDVHCDVVTIERARKGDVDSLLVPVAGGPHSGLCVAVAGAIAANVGATVELFHVVESGETSDQTTAILDDARVRMPRDVATETTTVSNRDLADAIVGRSETADVTVVGEPTRSALKRILFGSLAEEVREGASNTVVVCRRGSTETFG